MSKNILDLLEKLISFKSITPQDDGCMDFIANFLKDLGFQIHIKHFGEGSTRVTNLYAIYGKTSPNICFAGHVDVVPPMDLSLWKHDPFTMTIDGEKVYGRGSVDMKGGIACQMAAVAEFLKHNQPNGSISFLLTSDEEGPAQHGTVKMLEYIKDLPNLPKIDFCILGEPTSEQTICDTIKIGRRGSINFQMKIIGKQGHVAYPEKAISPFETMNNIIADLLNNKLDDGSEFFGPSNLEITSIDTGNGVTNVIPEAVMVKFNIRFNDHHSSDSLALKIKSIIEKYSNNFELKHHSSASSFIQKFSDNMQKLANIAQKECGRKPAITTNGGTSDARFIHKYSEVAELGLNSNMAHKIDEYTKISDLQTLYNVYYASLVEYL